MAPAKQNAAATTAWAPRSRQEARLRQLDQELAQMAEGDARLLAEIERASLLGALDLGLDARKAFIAILEKHPTHFTALNEFATLLASQGAIDAASRVYTEAILHHPDKAIAHVNLANLLLRANRHAEARTHYEAALNADPDFAPAHQGLGAVLADEGDREAAQVHFRKGFRDHAVSTLPYRGSAAPIPLLQLVSSGGGNIPTAPFLDDRVFLTSVVVADHLDIATKLPPHALIFNAIGDADLCEPALRSAIRLIAQSRAPVINDPLSVIKTGRVENAARLSRLPGVVTPRTLRVARSALADAEGAGGIAASGFPFPLLLRSPGYHTGRNFVLVEKPTELATAATALPGDDLLVIEYLDARRADGNARKYRVMMIGGKIFPLHLAISRNWKVHYFTSDMAERFEYRDEEMAFLNDMAAVLGKKAMTALHAIRDTLDLDYAGVDFGLNSSGDLLLFEANATMVIASPDPDPRWAYRGDAIAAVTDAVVAMIRDKAGGRLRRK